MSTSLEIKKQTHQLTFCAMMAALAVVFLALGGLLGIATYAAPLLAAMVLIPVRERCSKAYAWSCFAASALLGLLLGADKEADMLFLFLGWYPLVQPRLNAVRPVFLQWLLKLLLFAADLAAVYLLLLYVIGLQSVLEDFASGFWLNLASAVMGIALLIISDLLFTRFTRFWQLRFQKQNKNKNAPPA